MRLDQWIADNGHAPSRARARDLILRGLVMVNGTLVTKPAKTIADGDEIAVDQREAHLVSRAARKLEAALDAFDFDATDRNCLDLGASTGGFTQILLERGARSVIAVDVGRDQLDERLRTDPRVRCLEQTDARSLDRAIVPEVVSAITADLSFISLAKAIGPAMSLAAPGTWLTTLVKPQFEVGRSSIGRGGIVRSARIIEQAVDDVAGWINGQDGWQVVGRAPSPIEGGDGNREWLIGARRHG